MNSGTKMMKARTEEMNYRIKEVSNKAMYERKPELWNRAYEQYSHLVYKQWVYSNDTKKAKQMLAETQELLESTNKRVTKFFEGWENYDSKRFIREA